MYAKNPYLKFNEIEIIYFILKYLLLLLHICRQLFDLYETH